MLTSLHGLSSLTALVGTLGMAQTQQDDDNYQDEAHTCSHCYWNAETHRNIIKYETLEIQASGISSHIIKHKILKQTVNVY